MQPELFTRVKRYFAGNEKQTWEWFNTPSFALSQKTPIQALKAGMKVKVERIVKDMENQL